ncbi:MAG TPA: DMT family transporter [Candidatus Eisenbacteria bacterium]|jgi:drug/metabolite transporter (DMT)-like permease
MPDSNPTEPTRSARTALLTVLALVAFASNSILCRLALGAHAIDAGSFTSARLASGAAALLAIRAVSGPRRSAPHDGGWISAGMLFSYAATFSFAYLRLSAGTGALVLFGSVQATMILAALRSGERFAAWEGIGLALALAGLLYLVSPGWSAPSALGCALMAAAGISWGLYTLRGRVTVDPLGETARNFIRSLVFAVGIGVLAIRGLHLTGRGLLLAVLSGALASGVGYVLWYAALRDLTAIRAATVQLSVPVLAALGGLLFLSEAVSLRLLIAAALILGGVGLAIRGRRGRPSGKPPG